MKAGETEAAAYADDEALLEKIVKAIESQTELFDEHTYNPKARAKMGGRSFEHIQRLQQRAKEVFLVRQQEAKAKKKAEAIAALRESAEATVASVLAKLEANDTAIAIPDWQLVNVEKTLRAVLSDLLLMKYNDELRAKSKPLTYSDLAWIACVHRDSVLYNGDRKGERFDGTSPFRRISEASTAILKRETPFDNRQIRQALTILEGFQFTKQTSDAVHGVSKKANRAATWEIVDSPVWNDCFDSHQSTHL